ncbi:MAG: hypothetical protein JEY91_07945 [Spirochaetaceae bacterium]|nr:hypothetical protein [Spirochaetaceae bacterium]
MAVKQENVINRIKSSINQNNLIHDASHLSFQIKSKGFLFWKKYEIHIRGRVDLENEKSEIDKILEVETEGMTVFNNLRVQKR